MSDEDKIQLTQKDAAQRLARGVIDFAAGYIEAGMPPSVVHVGLLSACVSLASMADGTKEAARWLRDIANMLENTADPRSDILPGGTA